MLVEKIRFSNVTRNLIWGIVSVALILFAGLRADTVGADTNAYINQFYYLHAAELIWHDGSFEVGVKLIYAIAVSLAESHTLLLVLFSTIAIPLSFISIRKYSKAPDLSLFLFITLGFFVFHFNGTRQGLAFAFYMMSFSAIDKGKFFQYSAWVLIGSLFHTSVIFTLPLYYVFRKKFSWRSILWIALSMSIFVVFTDVFFLVLGNFSERYASYADRSGQGGGLLTIFNIAISIIFIIGRYMIALPDRHTYDIMLNMFIAGTVVFILVALTNGYVEMTRIAIYFTVAEIFLWPQLLRRIRPSYLRFMSYLIVLAVHILYYFIFLNQIGYYIPYVLSDKL